MLFVSHNMGAVQKLCSNGVVLAAGRVQKWGPISEAVAAYSSALSNVIGSFSRPPKYSAKPSLVAVTIAPLPDSEEPNVVIEIIVAASEQTTSSIQIRLKDALLAPVAFGSLGVFESKRPILIAAGINRILLKMSTAQLANGEYFMSVDLVHPFVEFIDRLEDCVRFRIEFGSGFKRAHNLEQDWGHGSVVLPLEAMERCELLPDLIEGLGDCRIESL